MCIIFRSILSLASTAWLVIGVCVAEAQQLSGLSIGDRVISSERIGFAPTAVNRSGPFILEQWRLPDGNDLSVTSYNDGTIVYIESNWNGGISGRFTDFAGLMYGQTTLNELRAIFGNNGFCFIERCTAQFGSTIVHFNSFEVLDGPVPGIEIIPTFVTSMPIWQVREGNSGEAKLETLILAERRYLDGIWGEGKSFDPAYRPIRMR